GLRLRAAGTFQRTNFALACAGAEAFLGAAGSPMPPPDRFGNTPALDPAAVAQAAASTLVPGRFETVGEHPLTILDGAHNPAGFVALAASLREVLDGRRLVAVLSVLDDKDAVAMLERLLALCGGVVFTTSANPRSLPAATLAALAGELPARVTSRVEADPRRALVIARELAGQEGVVLATGSIYLVADLLRPSGAGPGSIL
nr:hypothetical protein [Solirubrobacterales bacterium]